MQTEHEAVKVSGRIMYHFEGHEKPEFESIIRSLNEWFVPGREVNSIDAEISSTGYGQSSITIHAVCRGDCAYTDGECCGGDFVLSAPTSVVKFYFALFNVLMPTASQPVTIRSIETEMVVRGHIDGKTPDQIQFNSDAVIRGNTITVSYEK